MPATAKEVRLNDQSIWVSPMELQIAFKLYLGTDKDLEDVRHLYDVANSILDLGELKEWTRKMDVPERTMQRSRMQVDP